MKYGDPIQVRMTPELEAAVNQFANENEISVSDVVRMALRRWLIPSNLANEAAQIKPPQPTEKKARRSKSPVTA